MHVHDIISLKDGYANASMRVPSYGTVDVTTTTLAEELKDDGR